MSGFIINNSYETYADILWAKNTETRHMGMVDLLISRFPLSTKANAGKAPFYPSFLAIKKKGSIAISHLDKLLTGTIREVLRGDDTDGISSSLRNILFLFLLSKDSGFRCRGQNFLLFAHFPTLILNPNHLYLPHVFDSWGSRTTLLPVPCGSNPYRILCPFL